MEDPLAMRICVLTTSFPRFKDDEASVFVGRLVDAFSEEKLSGVVVVPRDSDEALIETRGSFELVRYRYGIFTKGRLAYGKGILQNVKRDPLLFLQVPLFLICMFKEAFVSRKSWDIIQANWLVTGIVAYLLSLVTRKPYVVTIRGVDAGLLSITLLKPLWNVVLRGASGIVSVNESFLADIHKRFPATAKLHCIPNGTERTPLTESAYKDFLKRRNLSQENSYLLFVGRAIPLKKIEKLIELLAQDALSDYTLLVVGRVEESYREQLATLADNKGVTDKLRFEGAVTPSEVEGYLRVARFYVTASSHEGRSNSVLEALSAGLPVIASDIPGHREVITDGFNGVLFSEDQDISEIAKRVSLLNMNSERYDQFSMNAKKSVEHLTWGNASIQYKELFQNCISK